jgi:hypothetical protein
VAAFAFPGVQADVVVIAAGRNECRAGIHPLHQLKPEHAAIKSERAIEVGHFKMNMPDPRSRDDGRRGIGHGVSPQIGLSLPLPATAGRGRHRYASSDTWPSGSPNSNVLSVIETIV